MDKTDLYWDLISNGYTMSYVDGSIDADIGVEIMDSGMDYLVEKYGDYIAELISEDYDESLMIELSEKYRDMD